MHFAHQVRTLRREGLNERSIAAALGVNQEDVVKSLADPDYEPSTYNGMDKEKDKDKE